jgi:hypothetical protein
VLVTGVVKKICVVVLLVVKVLAVLKRVIANGRNSRASVTPYQEHGMKEKLVVILSPLVTQ